MPTPIRIKRSAVAGKRPTTDQLQLGELAFNYNDGHLYAKRDTAGVGIGTTTALLTPWKENIGGESIYFENNVGIGSSVPAVKLDVDGSAYIANDLEVVGTLNLSTTTGVSTFSSAVDINGILDVDGQADLDEVVVAGVATFSNAVDINSTLDVDGDTQLDDLTVAGVATFSSLIDANNRLDVVGGANLDQLNVTGVSTLTGNVSFGTSAFFGDNDKINMGDGDDFQIYHASNGTGVIQNAGTGQLQLRSNEIRLLNQATDEDFAFFRDDGAVELYYNNTKRFETSGIGVTITGETDINGDLNVSGVSTFTGAIDANGTLDVDGDTQLDDLNVAGVATFSSAVDINAGLDVDGQSDLDEVVIAGVSTFTNTTDNSIGNVNTGAVQLDGGMGIAKHLTVGAGLSVAEGLTVAGVSTFVGLTTFTGGNVHISNDLFVGGIEVTGGASIGEDITTRNLNVTGVATVGTGLSLGDDVEAHFGDSGDLRIFHSGVTGNIKNSTGTLILQSSTVRIQDGGSSQTAFSAADGVATLYYENSKKLETTGAGVSVSSGAGLTATIAGPANLIIDPTVVGDNTGTVRIKGDLLVDGTQFIANSTTIDLADHRVGIATTVGTNAILDGGGIGIGSANILKTITWSNSSSSLKSSDNWDLASGKTFKINGTDVLSSTTLGSGVVNSSLTNLGTLTALNSLHANVTGVVTAAQADIGTSGLDVDGQTDLDEVVVTGVATFSALVDANARLDVVGGANIDQLNVAGVSTIQTLGVTGDLSVSDKIVHTGDANTAIRFPSADEFSIETAGTERFRVKPGGNISVANDLNVTGVTTLGSDVLVGTAITIHAGNIHASTGIITALKFIGDGAGITNLPGISTQSTSVFTDVNISGTTTTTQLRVSGIGTAERFFVSTGGLEVDGQTDLDELAVAGVSTFNALIDANARIDVVGGANIDQANVSGVSTFGGNVDVNAALDVSGNITGTGDFTLTDTDDGSAAGPELKLYRNSASPADSDYLGQIKFAGESDTGAERNYAKITGKIKDASNGDEDGIIEVAHIKGGSQNISARWNSETLQLINDTQISVAGTATFSQTVDINGGGQANTFKVEDLTDNRVVLAGTGGELEDSGNLTFDGTQLVVTGAIDANGTLDVDGQTDLDEVVVAGVSTFSALIDANARLDVVGGANIDQLNITGVSTLGGDISIADKIIHTGDTNTAIRFPADDTVTVETAGSERVRVTDDGAIVTGIATIVSTTAADSNNKYNFVVRGDDSGTDDESAQIFLGATSTTTRGTVIAAQRKSSSNDHDLIFKTSDTSAVPVERVRISNVGRVGIGTVNPLDELHVNSSSTNVNLRLTRDLNTGARISGSDGASPAFIVETISSGTPTERFRVTSAGNVNFLGSLVNVNATGVSSFVQLDVSTGGLDVDGQTDLDEVVVAGVSTFSALIDANARLDVVGGANIDQLNVTGVSTFGSIAAPTLTGDVSIADKIIHTGDTNTAIRFPDADTFTVETGGSERLRVTSGGDVGIGTETPETPRGNKGLEVAGTTGAEIVATRYDDNLVDGDFIGGFVFKNLDAGGSPNHFAGMYAKANGTAGAMDLHFTGDRAQYEADTADLTIRSGLVGIGTAAPGEKLHLTTTSGNCKLRIDAASAASVDFYNSGTRFSDMFTDASTSNFTITNRQNAHIIFRTNGTNERFTVGNAGISTFHGTGAVTVPSGDTSSRPTGIAGMFRYNSEENSFEGFTDSWGAIAGGGATEVDTNVSSTSAVGVGSFATAEFRSAEVIAQIVQIDEYQVGKYLMIHDGTTVTVIEQAAVATGDAMLGSFDGAINGSNAELRVNMVSSGIATVTTKISTVTI